MGDVKLWMIFRIQPLLKNGRISPSEEPNFQIAIGLPLMYKNISYCSHFEKKCSQTVL